MDDIASLRLENAALRAHCCQLIEQLTEARLHQAAARAKKDRALQRNRALLVFLSAQPPGMKRRKLTSLFFAAHPAFPVITSAELWRSYLVWLRDTPHV